MDVGIREGIPPGDPVRASEAAAHRVSRLEKARLASPLIVALTVKKYAAAAGLDPARYAGHSLRAGLATAAAIGGASERSIIAGDIVWLLRPCVARAKYTRYIMEIRQNSEARAED